MNSEEQGRVLIEEIFKHRLDKINSLLNQEDEYQKSIPKNEKLYWLESERTKDFYTHFSKEVFIRRIKARKYGYKLYLTEKEWKNTLLRAIGVIPIGDEFNYAKDIQTIKINSSLIVNSFDLLSKKNHLLIAVPDFNYGYFLDQLKIDFNDKILLFFKGEFENLKKELTGSNDEKYMTAYTSHLLNEIEKTGNYWIEEASNFNFVRVSLDQLSQKIQDFYSESVSKIN